MTIDRVDAAALARAAGVTPTAEPGEQPPAGDALAGLWLSALERLVARAAHEVNGALNGLTVNVEVVRLKAKPGGDAGAIARFADAATEEVGTTVRLAGALVALGRTPAATTTDVAEVVRHALALVTAIVAREGVTLELEGAHDPAPTRADARAVRLAVVEALLAGAAHAAARTVEVAGSDRADHGSGATAEPRAAVRCILSGCAVASRADLPPDLPGGPGLRLDVRPPAGAGVRHLRLADDVAAALTAAGIVVRAGASLDLHFPPP